MKWDIVMLFLILYNVVMVPVRICFEVIFLRPQSASSPPNMPRPTATACGEVTRLRILTFLAVQVEAVPGSAEFWVETTFDMLFLVDIFINFNSA